MKITNLNHYKKMFVVYKTIPLILATALGILAFAWSIVDVSAFSYVNSFYPNSSYYGILHCSSLVFALFIWWIIGAALVFASFFISSIMLSPTILRTEFALGQIEKNELSELNGEKAKFCRKCGTKILSWANYCPKCGQAIIAENDKNTQNKNNN